MLCCGCDTGVPCPPAWQMEVDGDTTTVLVTDLKPSTKYVLTVRASYGGALGEPAATKGKTGEGPWASPAENT